MPRPAPSPTRLAQGLRQNSRAALSQAITLAESTRPEHQTLTTELLALLPPPPPHLTSFRLGITGSPGVGKSTFIETYGKALLEEGHRLAVLAVDPSSSRTGGSILGDKTRMPALATDARAYVRPSPAGQTLGGVASATRQAIALCEAAGYDRVIVETVGVGQSEHAVSELTDAMALLVLPGAGDDLQGIKRGIVELADLVLVHKADGERERPARQTVSDYNAALHLQPARADGWSPRAVAGSSVAEGGLSGFGESLTAYVEQIGAAGLRERRRAQQLRWFGRYWPGRVEAMLRARPQTAAALAHLRDRIAAGDLDVDAATAEFLAVLTEKLPA